MTVVHQPQEESAPGRRVDEASPQGVNVTPGAHNRLDAGDLGRRITERQDELELTSAQVAERAGMATEYVEYLEHTPTAEPSSSALVRIALALEMSESDLLGGEEGRARGRGDAAPDPHLMAIDDEACEAHLAGGGVGRVIFRSVGRPVAFPVNFKMLRRDIIFRSAGDGEVSAIPGGEAVSFEVDHLDDAMSEGWSVLASGTIHPVRSPEQVEAVEALGIEPWAGGDRNTYFRLSVTRLTGKRISAAR